MLALVFGQLLVINSFLTHARCISDCDEFIERQRYIAQMNYSNIHTISNVTVNLRDAEGSNDALGRFNQSKVCPWYYEHDYNSSRLPQVMYRARCNASEWCDHTGQAYKCKLLMQYQVPVLTTNGCNIFKSTEWSLQFMAVPIACYPSTTQNSFSEHCSS